MSIRINQSEDASTGRTVLEIEGWLNCDAVALLETMCDALLKHPEAEISINLKDVRFLNGQAAGVLRRLKQNQRVSLEGCHLFTKQIIEEGECS